MTTNEQLRFFADKGYVVVGGALTAGEVAAVNAGIHADRAAHPRQWDPGHRPYHMTVGCNAPELMQRTEAVDGLAHHPAIAPLVKGILGVGTQLSGLSYMQREACAAELPEDDGGEPRCVTRVWHREDGGNVAGADDNLYFVPSLQVIFYLSDVDAASHCFSIIPESAETKRGLSKKTRDGGAGPLRIADAGIGYVDPARPVWVDAYGRELSRLVGGVNIYGRAGTAVIFNNSSYHAGTVRQTPRPRRTLHVRYRQPEPVDSRHGLTEPWESVAQFTAALPVRPAIGAL